MIQSNLSMFVGPGDSDSGGDDDDEVAGILPLHERADAAPSGVRADTPHPSLGVLSRQLLSAADNPAAFPVIGDRVLQFIGSRRRPNAVVDISGPAPPDGQQYIDISQT